MQRTGLVASEDVLRKNTVVNIHLVDLGAFCHSLIRNFPGINNPGLMYHRTDTAPHQFVIGMSGPEYDVNGHENGSVHWELIFKVYTQEEIPPAPHMPFTKDRTFINPEVFDISITHAPTETDSYIHPSEDDLYDQSTFVIEEIMRYLPEMAYDTGKGEWRWE